MPTNLGFTTPKSAGIWFEGRAPQTVKRIDFQGNSGPGGTVIRCDVRDFASDDQPLHRLYTPHLLAYADGTEKASQHDLQINRVCVDASLPSTPDQEECADQFNPTAWLNNSEKLITMPEEQGVRDGRLILLGAVAGAAAAAYLEALTGVGSLLYGKFRRSSRQKRPTLTVLGDTP